jgi:hypothetical protein
MVQTPPFVAVKATPARGEPARVTVPVIALKTLKLLLVARLTPPEKSRSW